MNIAFNINYLGLEGLGATLSSLIRNCSNSEELTLWFLCSNLKDDDKSNIRQHLENERFEGKIQIIDFDAKENFGYMRSLHGDLTAYGRLLIADYVDSDVALYLDADLAVELDILTLKNFKFNDELLAAANPNLVKFTLDNTFFIDKLNWNPETSYFNSGVLLLNLKKWRKDNMGEKWKQLSLKYPKDLISHDQTLLNALCEGKFGSLPDNFNNFWYPNKREAELKNNRSILHFVGSPKPWDLFGNLVHYGYPVWKSYNTSFWQMYYGKLTRQKLKRTYKIRRSIVKQFINRIKSKERYFIQLTL